MMEDSLWTQLRRESEAVVRQEPKLSILFQECLLKWSSFEEALSVRLARKLSSQAFCLETLQELLLTAFSSTTTIQNQMRQDILAVKDRDPACEQVLIPFFYFKGFHALCTYRAAHYYWQKGDHHLALYLQSILSATLAVDIHPAARIGSGILLDHATNFVAGETTVIEDNVSILHEVTLGGTGKEQGDRHPKVRQGVLIGSGAKILGNIEIGTGAKVGAGSVVLNDVSPHTTVAGVPAKTVSKATGKATGDSPALCMDHHLESGADQSNKESVPESF